MSLISKLCRISLVILLVLLCLGRATPVSAGSKEWTGIGPFGGEIEALYADLHAPNTLYAEVLSGIYKSTNGGETWTLKQNGMADWPIPGTLRMASTNPTTLYVSQSNNLYKSTDGAEHWTLIPSSGCLVGPIIVDPLTPTTFYSIYPNSSSGSVYKSLDGSAHCIQIDTVYTDKISALVIDPVTPSTLYAGTADGAGVLKSTDGGMSWIKMNTGLTSPYLEGIPNIDTLAIDPSAHNTLYAGTWYGIFKSIDGGNNWTPINNGLISLPVHLIVVDPANPNTLYACNYGIFKSINGGDSWTEINHDLYLEMLMIDPFTPSTLYGHTSYDGVVKSTNGGQDWVDANTGMSGIGIYSVAIDPITPTTLYLSTSFGRLFKSTDRGKHWIKLDTSAANGGIGGSLVVDPKTPTTLYVSGRNVFKSTDGGASWAPASSDTTEYSFDQLVTDPITPTTLYATVWDRGVFKSTNSGQSWSPINTGLPDLYTASLMIDPLTPSNLYLVSGVRGVYKSINGGQNWFTFNNALSNYQVSALAIDPQTPSTLYAGANADPADIFKSTNGGQTWARISTGLKDQYISVLTIDPQIPTTLYAGIGWNGIYRSTDGGVNWTSFSSGLTSQEIGSLAFDPKTPTILYAGSAKAGLFIRQQIPPLSINHSGGAPGSAFTVTGTQFTPNITATISVNKHPVGTAPTDAAGNLSFTLTTAPETDEGYYMVSAETPIALIADTAFILDADDTTYPPEGSADSFAVPDGIAYFRVMMPSIRKGN